MSKYLDKNIGKGYSNIGNKVILPNISEDLKNKIFSNINSVSFPLLYDLITPDIKLTFFDKDNNSVSHALLNVSNKTIPEDTKLKLLKFFIKRGAPINTYNKNKMTPLHLAIENSHHLIVDFLLKNGANPNAETINNLTALQLALNATVVGCKTDIIPKEFYPNVKENKNELTKEVTNFFIDKYNIGNNPFINKVFEDYKESFKYFDENKELLDNIKIEVLKLLKSDMADNELNSELIEKKKGFIKDIAEKLLIDNDSINDNIISNVDINALRTAYEAEKVNEIISINSVIELTYKNKLQELIKYKNDFLEYKSYFHKVFRSKLYFLSKNMVTYNSPGAAPTNGVFNYVYNYYPVPTEFFSINLQLVNFSPDYRELDNLDFDNKEVNKIIRKYKGDYLQLENLNNDFFRILDTNLFDISPANIGLSYKFILLNYIKICYMLSKMRKLTNKYNNYSFFDSLKNTFKKFRYINPAFIPIYIPIINNIILANQYNVTDDYIEKFINDFLISSNLSVPDEYDSSNLQAKYYDINEMIKLINERNKISYFFRFLDTQILKGNANQQFYSNYFNLAIPNAIINESNSTIDLNNKDIKFFNNGLFTTLNGIPFVSVSDIYPCEDRNNNPSLFNNNPDGNNLKIFDINPNKEGARVPFEVSISNFNYFFRDGTNNIYTVDTGVINLIRHIIIKELMLEYQLNKANIDALIQKYNESGIKNMTDEEIFYDILKNISTKMVTELLNYYKYNYAKEILSDVLKDINSKIKIDDTNKLTFDITKLKGLDYRYTPNFFSNIPRERYYNFNYLSNDSTSLCYKNNYFIINYLLNDSTTNYNIRDMDNNTILHKLVDINNFELFNTIYNNNINKFEVFKTNVNINNKKPVDLVRENYNNNHNEFFKDDKKLLFSERYSSFVVQQIKEINELFSSVPTKIDNLFDDIYIIFNLDKINIDIFSNLTTKNEIKYNNLFGYDITNKLSFSNVKGPKIVNIIIDDKYNKFIQDKYKIGEKFKYLSANEYYRRFWDTITHGLTLHFSNLYYNLIYDFFIKTNKNKLGITETELTEFKNKIFNYDPNYENTKLNLAQTIVTHLFKVKYNENTNINKKYTYLTPLLKSFNSYINILDKNKEEINDHFDKVIDYMQKYFDVIKPKMDLFLNNYVKFIELQYNLQKIEKIITVPDPKKASIISSYNNPKYLETKLKDLTADTSEKKFAWMLFYKPLEIKEEIKVLCRKNKPIDISDFFDNISDENINILKNGVVNSDKTQCKDRNDLITVYQKSKELERFIKRL